MPAITNTPFAVTDAILTLGSDTFEDAVGSAMFTPSYSNLTYDAINGKSHAIGDVAVWTLTIEYAQDWTGATSLANYLAANDGTIVTASLRPTQGGTAVLECDVLIRAGAVGGAARQTATATVTLPCDGAPAWTVAA